MKINKFAKAFVFMLSLPLVSFAPAAYGARVLLDDFSGTYIDGQKWENGEYVREIVGGKLVSKVGNTTTNGQARNTASFQNPETINIIEVDATVVATNLDTGTNVSSFARIDGRFYNTQATGGETGDIWAGVYIGDRDSGLEAWWGVYESLDDAGNNWEEKGSGTLFGPGILTHGTAYTAKIEYDGTNQFTFTVAGQSESFNTGPARQRAAVTGYKGLVTVAYSDGGSGTGYASALFDNVYINNLAAVYDDFSTAPLDQTKWQSLEYAREISGGKLRMNVQADGSRQTMSINPNNQPTAYLEAKVLVESASQISAGAYGIARICGYWYNETRGPGSGLAYNGNEGDVWVQGRIGLDDSNHLTGYCDLYRHDEADPWGAGTTLFHQDFTTPFAFDTAYTLSIELSGKTFIFKCNNETYTYEVTTPMYEPSAGQSRCSLQSRVYAGPGESGYMKTTFDDVYIAGDAVNPMVAYDNALAVDFGANGLYNYDSAAWSKTSASNAQWLATYNNDLVADFGAAYGLYQYDGASWTKISTADADNTGNTMVAYNNGLAVDFGANGLYHYDGAAWAQISTSDAQWFGTYSDKLVADFGDTYGLYQYDGAAWTKISTADADNTGNTMVAYNNGLAVDFGANGLYNYDGAAWTRISASDARWLGTYSDKLVADFGAAYGLYQYDGAAWTKISTADADNSGNTMVAYNNGLAVDFGDSGLYHYDGAAWTKISANNAEWLGTYSDKLVADFGAAYGLYQYDGAAWTKISTADVDN